MNIKPVLWCALVAANASAVELPQPQPLAPSSGIKGAAQTAPMRRLPSPTINETRATRKADGSLAIDCVQKINPKAKAAATRVSTPIATGAQP